MNDRTIITIGRQFGSGGRAVGRKIAEELEINYYDKEILSVAAKESGLSEDVFEKADEHASNGMSYALSMGYSFMGMLTPYSDILSNDGLFKIQSDAMRNLAEKESCVIVGRCADYILREDPALISFFIHDTDENRVQRIIENDKVTVEEARERMAKIDKQRAAYYNYYTNKTWGASASYHFSINVAVLGVDGSVALVKDIIERKQSGI